VEGSSHGLICYPDDIDELS